MTKPPRCYSDMCDVQNHPFRFYNCKQAFQPHVMTSVMFLSMKQRMWCGIGLWKDEGHSSLQGEDWEAGTEQFCACPHPKLGYQLRGFQAKGNNRILLPEAAFLGLVGVDSANVCSAQALCTCAVEEPLGCAVFIVQMQINCLLCKAGLTLPRYIPFTECPRQSFSVHTHVCTVTQVFRHAA